MPNWCSNDIVISGPEDKIKDLWEAAQFKEGLLEAIAPIGEWDYDTAVAEWGTKWDVELHGLEHKPGEISGWFESAWSPPIEAIDTFLGNNPDCKVQLKYFEPGMCFVGEHVDGVENTLSFDNPNAVPHEWYTHWNLGELYEQDEEEA